MSTAAAIAPEGIEASVYEGMDDLPHFNPDDDQEASRWTRSDHAPVEPGETDAVFFCAPEYAGAMPGSFKNLLD